MGLGWRLRGWVEGRDDRSLFSSDPSQGICLDVFTMLMLLCSIPTVAQYERNRFLFGDIFYSFASV